MGRDGELNPTVVWAVSAAYRDFLPDERALRELELPSLVLVGDKDMGVTGRNNRAEGARVLASMMPNAKLVLIPGDHIQAFQSPEFMVELLQFLADQDID